MEKYVYVYGQEVHTINQSAHESDVPDSTFHRCEDRSQLFIVALQYIYIYIYATTMSFIKNAFNLFFNKKSICYNQRSINIFVSVIVVTFINMNFSGLLSNP